MIKKKEKIQVSHKRKCPPGSQTTTQQDLPLNNQAEFLDPPLTIRTSSLSATILSVSA
jgi:hypothetical protein